MKIGRIPEHTRLLATEQRQYRPLYIRDQVEGGVNYMTSQWEPDSEDIAKIVMGAPLLLSIAGTGHPPVLIQVGAVPESAGVMDVDGGTGPSQELYRWRVWEINSPDPATNRSRHQKEFDAPNYVNAIQQACAEWSLTADEIDAERI